MVSAMKEESWRMWPATGPRVRSFTLSPAHDPRPGEDVQMLRDLLKGHRFVAPGQEVADVRDRSVAVHEVQTLVRQHVTVRAGGQLRRGRRAQHGLEVVVVVDPERTPHVRAA